MKNDRSGDTPPGSLVVRKYLISATHQYRKQFTAHTSKPEQLTEVSIVLFLLKKDVWKVHTEN